MDDLRPPPGRPDPLFMAVVRSPYAHARIGAIAAPPTIVNAVLDALVPLAPLDALGIPSIPTLDMPLRPEKIWALLHQAHAK